LPAASLGIQASTRDRDLGVLGFGIELLQFRTQTGPLGRGGGEGDALEYSSYKKYFYPSSLDKTLDMKAKELIQKEIEVFPEPYLEEILDFIHFLKVKASKNRVERAILSESVLATSFRKLAVAFSCPLFHLSPTWKDSRFQLGHR
jgi:hypothetical protein